VSPEWLGLGLLAVYVPASLLHAVHLPARRVGNAAEHVTAVFVAYRNKVDLALAVSVGSCIQIALFVIPLLVLLSKQILPGSKSRMLTGRAGWIMGKPMSLLCALFLLPLLCPLTHRQIRSAGDDHVVPVRPPRPLRDGRWSDALHEVGRCPLIRYRHVLNSYSGIALLGTCTSSLTLISAPY
jgi:hypothetical protein